jgi:hypothetical protein
VICLQCKKELSEIEQVDYSSKRSEVGNKIDVQKLQEDVEELKDTCISKRDYFTRNQGRPR